MKTTLLIVAILAFTSELFADNISTFFYTSQKQEKKHKKNSKSKNASDGVSIKEKWDLPAVLREVSGIAYLDKDRFACVQDEAGSIYIFNKASGQVEKEIAFSGAGDFEGLTLNGITAYVIRSDGALFEVNMDTKKTSEYKTGLPPASNIEGLCFDAGNNRLLIAGKAVDENYAGYKVVYAFDLVNKHIEKSPVYKINMEEKLLQNNLTRKKASLPLSEIAINPVTHDIFITDGPNSRLLILDKSAGVKKLYELGSHFAQPEGITFSPQGDLYISNEGKHGAGNIIEVELK
jgi:uncharacterized protein YjiK